ncbi:MAG: hypothetical protein ACM30G_19880 [Micromonosporaceae bacterium]
MIRPKLRPDVYLTTSAEGVYVLGPHGEARFNGPSIHLWLDRLRPYLDGRHSLADLTRDLSADRAAMVEQVVQALRDNDLLVEAEPADGTALVFGCDAGLIAAVLHAAHRCGLRRVRITQTRGLAQAQLFARRTAAQGIASAQAVTHGAHVWLGVAQGDGGWRRLDPAPSLSSTMDRAATTVIASQLVHLATTGRSRGRMTRVEVATLSGRAHAYLRHPLSRPASAQSEAQFLSQMADLAAAPPLDPEEFSRRAVATVDTHLGVLRGLGENGHPQSPLHIAEVKVSDPVGLGGGTGAATGCGLDVATARHRAVLAGLAAYGSVMVDRRRFLAGGSLWGYRLRDRMAVPVPAERIFPALRGQRRPPTGVACGYGWAEAVANGLMAHCHRLTLAEPTAPPDGRIDLDAVALDETATRYLALLTALVDRVTVHDITGSLGVPTVAVRSRGDTVAAASASCVADAVRLGLERALLHYQPAPMCPLWIQAGEEVDATAAALAAAGHEAVVVPLDHDPELAGMLPPAAHVLLADG